MNEERERDRATAPRRRDRRSREDVSEALIEAAATLANERGSGHVTVRDIAARAGVNAALVHRYYGSKRNLMRAAMQRAQARLASRIDEVPDIVEGAAAILHATLQERELIATLTRAALDGVFGDVPASNPATAALVERVQREAAARGGSRHDPRVVVTCLSATAVGYALLGDYFRHSAGLDGHSADEVEAMLVDVLRDVAGLAFSADDPAPTR
jgi:TetR/AcrR family transcriptional regulator, repressor for neighboring sulfatase